jgi:hypothetical protein
MQVSRQKTTFQLEQSQASQTALQQKNSQLENFNFELETKLKSSQEFCVTLQYTLDCWMQEKKGLLQNLGNALL